MSHLATLGLMLAFALAAGPTVAPAEPLTTSCQCLQLVCGNGSTAVPCQATCPGTAVCSCATCIPVGSGSRSSYASGPNSCYCQ